MNNATEMIKILFPRTTQERIDYLVYVLRNKCSKFGVNTDLRLAHFLAQARHEIGSPEFKPVQENLNYSESALPKVFRAFRGNNYAELYGRNSKHKANQEMIANIAYAHRLGNGDIASGDGWTYRGAGSLQITGKSNFEQVQIRIDRYLENGDIQIKNDIHTVEGCLVAGLGFWIWKDIYRQADLGTEEIHVDAVTRKINLHTDSYIERRENFNLIKHLINI